jgi:WD40 repeat protein
MHGTQLLTGPGRGGRLDLSTIGLAYLWDLDTGKELRRFEGHVQEIQAVAFLPGGKQILTGAGRPALGPDRIAITEPIRLLDVETGREIRRFEGHTSYVEQLEVSADGSRFVAWAGEARVWNINTGQLLCVISGASSSPPSVRFDRSGTKLVGNVSERPFSPFRMKVWDASNGAELATIVCDSGRFEWLEFSPEGDRVLSGSSKGVVRIFDWKTGAQLGSFVGHTRNVHQASYLGDGQRIMTASADLSVRIWEVSTGKELMRIDNPGAVSRLLLSGDGKRLLTRWSRSDVGLRAREDNPSQRGMSLWNVESGKLIKEFGGSQATGIIGFMPETQFIVVQRSGKPFQLIDGTTCEVVKEYK